MNQIFSRPLFCGTWLFFLLLALGSGCESIDQRLTHAVGSGKPNRSLARKIVSSPEVDGNAVRKHYPPIGTTLLHQAAIGSWPEICAILIEKGADVNATDQHGYTPLHWASYIGSPGVAELLIKQGARVNATNEYSDTPLHYAIKSVRYSSRRDEVVALLISSGANPNARNKYNDLPLHIVMELKLRTLSHDADPTDLAECDSIIATLISAGADPALKNSSGQSANDLAREISEMEYTLRDDQLQDEATDQSQESGNSGYNAYVPRPILLPKPSPKPPPAIVRPHQPQKPRPSPVHHSRPSPPAYRPRPASPPRMPMRP
ncbi:MAG: ankyrin repeat domain-containing protein [Kiritimatiellia bacterium]